MKKEVRFSKHLLTLGVLSSIVSSSGALATVAKAEAIDGETTVLAPANGFHFVATIVDKTGTPLSGKEVVLTDSSDGKILQTALSNDKGQAIFANLPLHTTIKVTVDHQVKDDRLQASEVGTALAASFTAEGASKESPIYSTKPLVVYVVNQDAEPIANKEVILKDRAGNIIDKMMSGQDGLARFTKNLLDKTLYSFYIDDQKLGETMPGISVSAAIKTTVTSPATPLNETTPSGNFSFTVTILGEDGKVVEGKNISIFSNSGRNEKALKEGQSDANGQVTFDGLPLDTNISVSIDGKAQGYTIRTNKDGQKKAAAFYIPGKGSKLPVYTKTPLTILVVNGGGEALSGQTVALYNKLGQKVTEMKSGADGKAVFTDKLMEGTFYDFSVNGFKMNSVTPGNRISATLSSKQIQKLLKPSDSPSKPEEKDKGANKVAVDNTSSHSSKKDLDSQKNDGAPSVQENNAVAKSHSKKVLPKTGAKTSSMLSLLGFISIGILSLIPLVEKASKQKN